MGNWSSLGVPVPERDASDLERMRFVRDLSARSLIFAPIVGALVVVYGAGPLGFLVLAVAVLLPGLNVVQLTRRMRDEARRAREDAGPPSQTNS